MTDDQDDAGTTTPGPLVFDYENHEGQISTRTVHPLSIEHRSTPWHPVPDWLMSARDLSRPNGALRDFSISRINPADRPALLALVEDMEMVVRLGEGASRAVLEAWVGRLKEAVPAITRTEPAAAAAKPDRRPDPFRPDPDTGLHPPIVRPHDL